MTTLKVDKKGKTKISTTNNPESSQRNTTKYHSINDQEPNKCNEFSDNEENSPTVLQTSSKDGTSKMDRNMANPSDEDKRRSWEEQRLGRASEVFTLKLSM